MARPNKNPYIPGVAEKAVVEALREEYSGFDQALLSRVKKPEKYAVDLIDAAKAKLVDKFGVVPAARQKQERKYDGHKHTRRAGCRLPDDEAEILQKYIDEDERYDHVSDLVHALLKQYMKRRRRVKKRTQRDAA